MDTTELPVRLLMAFGFSNAKECPNEPALVYSGTGRILLSTWKSPHRIIMLSVNVWTRLAELPVRFLWHLDPKLMHSSTTFPNTHTSSLLFKHW